MLNISDVVDVVGRNLTHYGRLDEILPNKEARVHFDTPRQPRKRGFCDECQMPGMLSIDGSTGEIVCMRTGCGHEHGFEGRDEIIPIGQLINISEQLLGEKKAKFKQEIVKLLQRGVTDMLVTEEQSSAILSLF